MQVTLKDITVEVEIIYKNNKNIYFRPKGDTLVVTCNRFVSQRYITKLINENEDSLYKMLVKSKKEENNDKLFNYLGEKYTIVYDGTSKKPNFEGDIVFIKDKKSLDKFYKDECERIFTKETYRVADYFDDIPKFKLRIRKMKTRWGVNNVTQKIITLNSELLKKEPHLLDYVIIHELCHFYEANHSKRFWDHVCEYYPDYKKASKELKEV